MATKNQIKLAYKHPVSSIMKLEVIFKVEVSSIDICLEDGSKNVSERTIAILRFVGNYLVMIMRKLQNEFRTHQYCTEGKLQKPTSVAAAS